MRSNEIDTARSWREMYGTLPTTRSSVASGPIHEGPPYRTLKKSGTEVMLCARQTVTSLRRKNHQPSAKTDGPMNRPRKETPEVATFPMQP
jgi:hypothetical protein